MSELLKALRRRFLGADDAYLESLVLEAEDGSRYAWDRERKDWLDDQGKLPPGGQLTVRRKDA